MDVGLEDLKSHECGAGGPQIEGLWGRRSSDVLKSATSGPNLVPFHPTPNPPKDPQYPTLKTPYPKTPPETP